MNKISRFILSPIKHILGVGYGQCGCCGFHWNTVESHIIWITEALGCFATCQDCWKNKSEEEIIDAYNRLYDSWRLGDIYNKPLTVEQIGFTRDQMLFSIKKIIKGKKNYAG